MNICTTFLLFFIGAAIASENTADISRIVGGNVAAINQHPSIVQMETGSGTYWYLYCSGNIINNRYILTAAHCNYGATVASRRFRTGTVYQGSGGVLYYAATIRNHPSFNSWTFDYDISLVRLSSNIVYNVGTQLIGIPALNYVVPTNALVTLAGWGYTTEAGFASTTLRNVNVNIVDWTICRNRYTSRPGAVRGNVTTNMICAGALDVGGRDACNYDDGGPVYYNNILVGIISWREGCARPYYPGVATRVSAFTTWIVQNAV